MKITTYSLTLLLVAVLAVPWVLAAPLEATPEEEDFTEAFGEYLEKNPAVAADLYPKLVNAAKYVSLTLDPDVVLGLMENYVEKETERALAEELVEEEKKEEAAAEEHIRRKRQTTISGGVDSSRNPFGRSISGSASVNHAWDNGRHSVTGSVGGQRDTISGLGSFNSYNAGVGYNFSPNKKTSVGINAHKAWTPAGNSHGFGINFTHKFGR